MFFAMIRMVPLLFTVAGEGEAIIKETPEVNKEITAEPVAVVVMEEEVESIPPEENLYVVPDDVPDHIETLLIKYSVRYGLPLDVVVRLSEVESNHGEYARSIHANFDGSYDIGILALNSNFIGYFGERYFDGDPAEFDPYEPEHNIQTGLAYLAHLNTLTQGDIASAVTAYNCGYRSMLSGDIPSSTKRYVRAVIHGESL